jgi:hypothetical protein
LAVVLVAIGIIHTLIALAVRADQEVAAVVPMAKT